VPLVSGDYHQPDYITNVLLTVLDLRMHNVAVDNSIQHYWDKRWNEIRTLDQLEDLLQRWPDDERRATRQCPSTSGATITGCAFGGFDVLYLSSSRMA
jgi:hypothetical protein